MAEGTFSDRLKAALQAKHWKQADLVRETGLDKNTVSALVNDKARPNPATVGRIEAALGVTIDTLAGSGEDRPAVAADDLGEAELIEALSYRLGKLRRERDEARRELAKLRGEQDGSVPEDQKNQIPTRGDVTLAARTSKGVVDSPLGGKIDTTPFHSRPNPQSEAGEEDQTPEGDEPA